jgi:2-polyprenyl-3-methyl-5-hydroxy-6-metoxy-1,4-benzoquinol methylase
MGVLIDRERVTYEEAWELPLYAENSPAAKYLDIFCGLAPAPASVLDAGCGAGRGAVALLERGYEVTGCDLTGSALPDPPPFPFFQAILWNDLLEATGRGHGSEFDWVFCCDVLEHLPQQFTMLAVEQMLRVSTQGVFLTIATQPDVFGVWLGKTFHQTVQHFSWWRDSLRELGEVTEARDMIYDALFVVRRPT